MKIRIVAVLFPLLLGSLLTGCGPGDIYVDKNATGTPDGSESNPFPTIQQGLDEATARGGGTVYVKGGGLFYPENIVMERQNTLRPWPGTTQPLIDGAPGSPTVTMKGWNTIDGFIIEGDNVAIEIDVADELLVLNSPTAFIYIQNCQIRGVHNAIRFETPPSPSFAAPNDTRTVGVFITHNWIRNLSSDAIRFELDGPSSGILIVGPRIQDNVLQGPFGSGIYLKATGHGPNPPGALRAYYDGFIKNNLIFGGGNSGIQLQAENLGDVSPEIVNNTIANHLLDGIVATATTGPDGVGSAHPILVNNIIVGNGQSGYQEFDPTTSAARLTANLFYQNGAGAGTSHYVDAASSVFSTAAQLNAVGSGSGGNLAGNDPLFDAGGFPWFGTISFEGAHIYFLTQGGATVSPALDTGAGLASDDIFDQRTTRTDFAFDGGTVDIGFHYKP